MWVFFTLYVLEIQEKWSPTILGIILAKSKVIFSLLLRSYLHGSLNKEALWHMLNFKHVSLMLVSQAGLIRHSCDVTKQLKHAHEWSSTLTWLNLGTYLAALLNWAMDNRIWVLTITPHPKCPFPWSVWPSTQAPVKLESILYLAGIVQIPSRSKHSGPWIR